MKEIKTIKDALESMSQTGVNEKHRWDMLALALQWIAEQQGCDIEQDMTEGEKE